MTTRIYTYAIDTTGDAGSATGSATTETLIGELIDVYLAYHASAPNTTDVTVAYVAPGGNVLAVSDANTSGLFAPRQGLVDNTGTAITDSAGLFALSGPLSIAVAGCDELSPAVTLTIRVRA